MRRLIRRLTFIALLLAALAGCEDAAPPSPLPGTFGWRTVASDRLGITLRVPDVFESVEEGDNLLLRFHGTPVRVVLVTPEEARRRGRWVTAAPPGDPVRLAGRDGHRYRYAHHDGPFYSRTIAYVFPHKGRLLGLEFRTDAADLDAVQSQVLASLAFTL